MKPRRVRGLETKRQDGRAAGRIGTIECMTRFSKSQSFSLPSAQHSATSFWDMRRGPAHASRAIVPIIG